MADKLKVRWDLLQLHCGVCGNPLTVQDGPWGCFYICSAYPKCFNRFNANLYDAVLDKVVQLMTDDPDINYTGYRWHYRTGYQHYDFRIAKHKPAQFIVEVVNRKKYKTPYSIGKGRSYNVEQLNGTDHLHPDQKGIGKKTGHQP